MNIEQRRRDFKRDDPDLYAYITHHEVARALDSIGDSISGLQSSLHAANYVWARGGQHGAMKEAVRDAADGQ